jgi:FixJ family two-component response regulator
VGRHQRDQRQTRNADRTGKRNGPLIADCKSTKHIAAELGLSIKTIETHRANVFAKLQVRSVAELVRLALRIGLVQL